MKNNFYVESPEVLYPLEDIVLLDKATTNSLVELAQENQRKRIRICAHQSKNDLLHEMIIVHNAGTYVRPHKHPGKTESMHVIQGAVDLILFKDDGQIEQVIQMGDFESGKKFFYRNSRPIFHTLLIRSDVLVFHEITNGPFDLNETKFSSWSPCASNPELVVEYIAMLEDQLKIFSKN